MGSKIEWTDETWNPVRGCTKVSPGCKHCYAETWAERFRGVPGHPYGQGFDPILVPHKLTDPLQWTRPKKVFVNSMSDFFGEFVPDNYILDIIKIMSTANWHMYQVLTKRSERMRDFLNSFSEDVHSQHHIWWGVSVEDKKHGLPRIDHLRETKVYTRFLSIEPLLEDLGEIDLSGIGWVIVGGESGPRARPMKKSWVESIRIQCKSAQVPFFFKQWGGVNKKKTGRLLNNKTFDEYPEWASAAIPSRTYRQTLARTYQDTLVNAWMIHDEETSLRSID